MDLGFGDSTAIWWYQLFGAEIRLIDYYGNSGEALTHYIKVIKSKPYIVERFFAPHDASSTELGSGLTRAQIARNLGVEFTILKRLSIQEGIDDCRKIFNRCWVDELRCEKGIHAHDNYRKESSESLGVWRDNPRHDHASHGADAFRYVAMSLMKVSTKEDEERAFREAMAVFNEPPHPLYGNGYTQGYL